jgi:hypothetical protein
MRIPFYSESPGVVYHTPAVNMLLLLVHRKNCAKGARGIRINFLTILAQSGQYKNHPIPSQ